MVANEKSGETLAKANHTKVQFSLRWKIALIFSVLFSAAFLLTLEVVTNQVTREADQQIKSDLTQALEGAAAGVDVETLIALADNGKPNEQGFSDDQRYQSLMDWLDTIHTVEPDAWPYLYVPAEQDGYIYFVVDLYANYDLDSSSSFMELYKSNSGYILVGLEEQTYRAVDAPLVTVLKNWSVNVEGWNQNTDSWLAARLWKLAEWITDSNIAPQRDFGTYGDQYGRWASGYMPLLNDAGEKVAGIGVDFKADMINGIQSKVRTTIWNTFLISYIILLPIIFLASYKITKPIVTLTNIADEIGNNNHTVIASTPPTAKKNDEIDVLEAVLFETYEKLRAANNQLHELSHQLISDREQYSKELARNLHDNVLSYLPVLSTKQQMVLDQEIVRDNYQHVVSRLRATIFSLRSPMMEYGLPMAIEDYLDSFEDQVGEENFQISVQIPSSDARFDNQSETHIFRIVQQAFENAIEHSKATEITIRGEIVEDRINISIEDNGTGLFDEETTEINPAEYKSRSNYGMGMMFERAALIGAKLTVKAKVDGGTIIDIAWQPQTQEMGIQ
jgi:signal transduction histidine kinase